MPADTELPPGQAEALEGFLSEFIAAWNRHDAAAMARAFEEEGDLLNTRGQHAVGRAEVEKLLAHEHGTSMRETRAEMHLWRARALGEGLAFAEARMKVEGVLTPAGERLPPLALHVIILAARHPETGWRYRAVRPYAFLGGF